jgi:hypothetical protein
MSLGLPVFTVSFGARDHEAFVQRKSQFAKADLGRRLALASE